MGNIQWAQCDLSTCLERPRNIEEEAKYATTPVWLHVYDVGHSKMVHDLDVALKDFLAVGGIFHGAVHVAVEDDEKISKFEWSYGKTRGPRSGVFVEPPKRCKMHYYRQSVYMGDSPKTAKEIRAIVVRLIKDWQGLEYDLLHHNCCSFSDAFCIELGVGPIPEWVHRLADAGAAIQDNIKIAVEALHELEDTVQKEEEALMEWL